MVPAAPHTFHLELFGSKTARLLSFHICGIEVLTSKGVYLVLDFGSIMVSALWFIHHNLIAGITCGLFRKS